MSSEAERNAVEKMKQGALQGIPGEPIGEPEPERPSEEPIDLPPHQRILRVEESNQALPKREKIPAAQLARIVFKLSTGEDEEAGLTKGEARILLTQMGLLNQTIETLQKASSIAEECLKAVSRDGAPQHQVIAAIAALKSARQ